MTSVAGYTVNILTENGRRAESFQENGAYYVPLPNNSTYQIQMINNNETRADAYVSVDGDSIGGWVLYPYSTVTIERHGNIARKLTFFNENSSEARGAGVNTGRFENGLVKVVFKPEKRPAYLKLPSNSLPSYSQGSLQRSSSPGRRQNSQSARSSSPGRQRSMSSQEALVPRSMSSNYSSGVTLLGDESSQRFVNVQPLRDDQIDYSKIVTINIRLVVDQNRYTRIPPRIDNYQGYFY